ncbi:MAG: glycosyltransferase family 2 protein [Rhodobiaceae bacterium]|jgi:glycosyltransferase involved in cell wall biosynthesis|nr:glycosyltransferase family 2 protein [Rhodobiaceae bacterium]
MKKLPISCFIIAKNEAARIEKTIKSAIDIVDEVIVIDSGSTDGTQKIASDLGCFVKTNAWSGYGQQKRFGEESCRNDWLLNLDADEHLTKEVKNEIIKLFENNMAYSFYAFKVVPIYHNWKKPRFASAYHNCVRLYDKTKGRFSDSAVHDSVLTKDYTIKLLKYPIYHNSVKSYSHLIAKQNSYIQLQVKTLKKRNIIILLLRFIFELPFSFFKYYIIRKHITGGLSGLITATIMSYFRWKRIILFIIAYIKT